MATRGPHAESCSPLMVPELFYAILDCFRPAFDPMGRHALAALAQTCRAFSEPSLDRLWMKLNSLEPLIRCYTRVVEVEDPIPPTSCQLAIIDRYSYRIRELTISESTSVRFLQCTSMRPSILFPNLMVLKWSPYVLTAYIPIIFIQRLLSPTLVSLEATFFDTYPLLCRNLKSIKFRFLAGSQTVTNIQALSRAICNQETLEKVVLHTPIDDIALKYLSTLPTLKVLTVDLSERWTSRSFLPTDPLFCNAEELEFRTSHLDLVTSILRPRDQILHTFCLCHNGRLTSEALVAFLNVLTSRSRTKPLQKLTLSRGNFSHPVPVDQMASEATRYRLSYETLQPLMALGSLRVLMIEWSEQIFLDDVEVANLARSRPLLQVFNLYCGRGGYSPFPTKYATLRGLLSLVKFCPELHTVSLPLGRGRNLDFVWTSTKDVQVTGGSAHSIRPPAALLVVAATICDPLDPNALTEFDWRYVGVLCNSDDFTGALVSADKRRLQTSSALREFVIPYTENCMNTGFSLVWDPCSAV